jgi:O-methyltransferase
MGVELRRLPPGKPARQRKPDKRLVHFQHLVDLIEEVPGDIVECGVGAGKSLYMLGVLTEKGKHPRRLWGFDSFRGLPPPAPEDEADTDPGTIRAGKYAYRVSDVRARMISYGMSKAQLKKRFVFVKGYFPDSFPQYSGGPIALLHLDVDLYQSYKDCLEWFEPLVAPGGVIAFDEYRHSGWAGATRGIEEYFGGPPPGIQKASRWNRWFLVKS